MFLYHLIFHKEQKVLILNDFDLSRYCKGYEDYGFL